SESYRSQASNAHDDRGLTMGGEVAVMTRHPIATGMTSHPITAGISSVVKMAAAAGTTTIDGISSTAYPASSRRRLQMVVVAFREIQAAATSASRFGGWA